MQKLISLTPSLCAFLLPATTSAQIPLGTEFTYQGRLKAPGMPAVSNADFVFSLFDTEEDGVQVGSTLSADDVGLVDGLFTVSLDFGPDAFSGDARWIEVAVRSPAGAGGFTTLAPRQQITATPFALQTRGITVNEDDFVGIGTATPGKKLTVAGDMELGIDSADYRHLRIGGGNSDGFLYGSFPRFGDGIHVGYNYFADAEGNHQIIRDDGGTSRISMGYGSIKLATAGPGGAPPVNRLTIDAVGNVHAGGLTINPILRSYTIHGTELMLHPAVNSNGIVYDDAGLRDFQFDVDTARTYYASPHLPDGATVIALELLGHDGLSSTINPLNDMLCVLGRTNFTGGTLEMAGVVSELGGHVWQTTSITFPIIDNDTHAYWVRVRLHGGAGEEFGHRVYAIRIIYEIDQPLP